MKNQSWFSVLCLTVSAVLSGCGGGGGGSGSVVPSPSQLTGVAATGSALANATVVVTDGAGNYACTQAGIVTDGVGSYTCTLKTSEVAPFFIVVTDPSGNTAPLVSIATTTPAAGTPLRVNATPLTTAIVAQLNNGDALGVATAHTIDLTSLAQAKSNILAQLQAVLSAIGAPADYDPFTTSITAATSGQAGNTADLVLDVVKVTTSAGGQLALSTISDPTPVPLATASTAGTSLTAPATVASDLSKGAQLAAQAFNACFSLPVSTRVTLDTSQNITDVANECKGITTQADVPTGALAFKHNGYSAFNFFYGQLTSSTMTGAKFSVPEIMAFYPADTANAHDRAVLNIRYLDSQGRAGNTITIASNFPGSSSTSRPSNWWLTGNQHNYDIKITTEVVRTEELNPNPNSHFQNALRIWVESRSWAPQNAGVTSVHVTGPGYPALGLWYARRSNSSGFVLANERSASLPASLTDTCSGCVSYWVSRTQGLSGTAANAYATNSSNGNWAQGSTDGSYNGQNGANVNRPKMGDVYTFDIYNGSTKVATETRKLLNNLVDATQIANLPWNDIGTNSRAALNPNNASLNGVQTSLLIDWIPNPKAEFIQYAWGSQTDGGYDNATQFPLGASSVLATPTNGSTYTALNVSVSEGPTIFAGYRQIGLTYRMTDGSSKEAYYQYWP
jgi:hypothetical protein